AGARRRIVGARLIEAVEVARLPEIPLELVVGPRKLPDAKPVADDDGPGNDAGYEQADHHGLHDDVRLEKQHQGGHAPAFPSDQWFHYPSFFSRSKLSTHARGCRWGRPSGVRNAAVTSASASSRSPRMTL